MTAFSSAAGDGYVGYTEASTTSTWAQEIAMANGNYKDATAAANSCPISQYGAGSTSQLARALFPFDTSSLDDSLSIGTVTLDLYCTAGANPDSQSYNVFGSTQADPATIANSDYSLVGSSAYATAIAYSSMTFSALVRWTFNATGIAAINLTGYTKLSLRISADYGAAQPGSSANYINIGMSEGADDPTLTVTAAPPPTLSSITPASGYNNASLAITDLAGTNLNGSSPAVKITKSDSADINATSVVQVSSSKVTCTLPITGATAGLWNVVYTDGNGSAQLNDALTVSLATPSVTSVSPSTAPNTEVITIMLTGSRLTGTNRVWFSLSGQPDVIATNIVVDSDTQVTCKVDFRRCIAGTWTGNLRNAYGSATF